MRLSRSRFSLATERSGADLSACKLFFVSGLRQVYVSTSLSSQQFKFTEQFKLTSLTGLEEQLKGLSSLGPLSR
jgi:hypothetical protein